MPPAPAPSLSERRRKLCRELGLDPQLLDGAQLWPVELRPIVDAIRKRPGGRLLVFGCGNDSRFWEAVNAGGTTAFLEDHADWAAKAQAGLSQARIHVVDYGTRLLGWRLLLDRPDLLGLDLPAEIAAQNWDVVLVDGPMGFRPEHPGRMKPIHSAPKLVAPGGIVFVHDCERETEAAFTARYLGEQRVTVSVKGRAQLKGYRF